MKNFLLRYTSLLFVFGLFVISSCKDVKVNDSISILSNEKIYNITEYTDSCSNSIFYSIVSKYLDNIWESSNIQWYTSVYFSENDSINYFTIWTFTSYPDFLATNNAILVFNYHKIEVNNTEVILITDKKKTDEVFSTLLIPSNNKIASVIKKNTNQKLIYDGRWFIQSYKYNMNNGNLNIEKLDTPIVGFLGNPPKEFW